MYDGDVRGDEASSEGEASSDKEEDDDGEEYVKQLKKMDDEQIQCVLRYAEAVYDLEPLRASSTWAELVKTIEDKLWPNGSEKEIIRLEYRNDGDENAETFGVIDTATLQDILRLFRESYSLRKQRAIEGLVGKIEHMLDQGKATSTRQGASIMEALLRSNLSDSTQIKILQLLMLTLQSNEGSEGGEARESVERAALAFILNCNNKSRARSIAYSRRHSLVSCLYPGRYDEAGNKAPELTEFGGLLLAAVASTKSGAQVLIQPDCFPSLLARILSTKESMQSEAAIGAISAGVLHRGTSAIARMRIAPVSIMLLAKLMRLHKSWGVRRCAASILTGILRFFYRRVKEKLQRDTTRYEEHDEYDEEEEEENDDDDNDDGEANDDETGGAVFGRGPPPSRLLDKIYDEAVCNMNLGPASRLAVGYSDEAWGDMLRHPEVLHSALDCALVASREINCMPSHTTFEIGGPAFGGAIFAMRGGAFANVVKQIARRKSELGSIKSTHREPQMTNLAPRRSTNHRTISLSSRSSKVVSSALEIGAHLTWVVSACLTGNEEWVTVETIKPLLELALFPLSPPEIRRTTIHGCAALEQLSRHARFAKVLSKNRRVVDVLRVLLERDALPNVQCWVLSIMHALLEASKAVRDELVVTNFRLFLANRMLHRAHNTSAHTAFMTLGAHMLASLTRLTMNLITQQENDGASNPRNTRPSKSPNELATSRLSRRKVLVMSTVVGMSNYVRSIAALLSDGPPASLRYTAMHLWLLARIPRVREDLVRNQIITTLVPRIVALVRSLRRCEIEYSGDGRSWSHLQTGFVRKLDGENRVQTLNQLAATVWVLLQSQSARDECVAISAVQVFAESIIELRGQAHETARRLLLCCLWQLAHNKPALQRRLLEEPLSSFFDDTEQDQLMAVIDDDHNDGGNKGDGKGGDKAPSRVEVSRLVVLAQHWSHSRKVAVSSQMSQSKARAVEDETRRRRQAIFGLTVASTFHHFLGHIGYQESNGIDVRLVACRFYYYLVEVLLSTAENQESFEKSKLGMQLQQMTQSLALNLIEMEGAAMDVALEHGALIAAKEARSPARKQALASAGMVEKLLVALRRATRPRTTTCILHAIFNISTHPANQVRTIRSGFGVLIRHARGSPAGTAATAFATRILENCRHQPAVASTYYKCELRLKANELRRPPALDAAADASSVASAHGACSHCTDLASGFGASFSGDSLSHHSAVSKLDSLKQRFNVFLSGMGDENEQEPVHNTNQHDKGTINEVLQQTLGSHHGDQTHGPGGAARRIPRLNVALSHSLADVWRKSRPATGAPETPRFSPRTTWSPQITDCSMREAPATLVRTAPKIMNNEETPMKSHDEIALGELATVKRPARMPDNMAPKRRKPNPLRVSVEGGAKFAFHRPIEEVLAALERQQQGSRVDEDDDSEPTMMVKFPHIKGSRVSAGLFQTFELPDGSAAHYYFRGRTHGHVVEGLQISEPIKPAEDLRTVLGDAHVPGGPRPPELPEDCWPRLYEPNMQGLVCSTQDSDAGRKAVAVAHSFQKELDMSSRTAAGSDGEDALEDKNFSLASEGHRLGEFKVENTITFELDSTSGIRHNEDLETQSQADKDELKWRVRDSMVWITRGADMAHPGTSRDFFHNQRFWARCVNHDWAELMKRTRFVERIRKLVGGDKDDATFQTELSALKATVAKKAELTSNVFHYFAAVHGSNAHSLGENGFKEFAIACKILDRKSKECNATTIDTVFIEANIQGKNEDKRKANEAKNSTNQIVRFEFIQALILLANAKYLGTPNCLVPSQALQKLYDENITRAGDNDPLATYSPDYFRSYSLYNADVEAAIMPHLTILQELYKAYNPTTAVKRRMDMKDWLKLLADATFFDEDFTRHEARLAFVFAQMKIADWTRYFGEFSSMSFADFLEALCRVAIVKTWPADAVLDMPVDDALAFFDNVESFNTDSKKQSLVEHPAPYNDWSSHNVAGRIKKLLLVLYRRLSKSLLANASLQTRCLRPGIARSMAQLKLRDPLPGGQQLSTTVETSAGSPDPVVVDAPSAPKDDTPPRPSSSLCSPGIDESVGVASSGLNHDGESRQDQGDIATISTNQPRDLPFRDNQSGTTAAAANTSKVPAHHGGNGEGLSPS